MYLIQIEYLYSQLENFLHIISMLGLPTHCGRWGRRREGGEGVVVGHGQCVVLKMAGGEGENVELLSHAWGIPRKVSLIKPNVYINI